MDISVYSTEVMQGCIYFCLGIINVFVKYETLWLFPAFTQDIWSLFSPHLLLGKWYYFLVIPMSPPVFLLLLSSGRNGFMSNITDCRTGEIKDGRTEKEMCLSKCF